ncbi:MAG: response regulator [Phycisphaeraceae bacterium]|nr:response regulator [Phycisphaeraceae bacterium]MCB9847423.1 response regulator [Phycisphaeraceae bacterium]
MSGDYLNTNRLTDRQRHDLLRSIEQTTRGVPDSRRQHTRHECHLKDVRIEVTTPDGKAARYLVCTRNISNGGIAFLHGAFLYPGSRCSITLPTVLNIDETLVGSIVNCRHLVKHIHEFSVQFDELIDTRRYLTPPGEQPVERGPEAAKLAVLRGTVLMVAEDAAKVAEVESLVMGSRVRVTAAGSVTEGLIALRSGPIDTVLLDIDSSGAGPAAALQEIRRSGYKGPIVGITGDADGERAKAALDAGADEILEHPARIAGLVRVLCECLSGGSSIRDAFSCQLVRTPDTIALVESYMQYIGTILSALAEGVEHDELEKVLECCNGIAQSAGGYGYPRLEQVARDAVLALNRTCSIQESDPALQRLRNACERLEPLGVA